MIAILAWVLFGCFWTGVLANRYLNRSESRRAWRDRVSDRVAFAVFDAYEWVRVTVLHRSPARYVTPTREDVEVETVKLLNRNGIRAAFITDDKGVRQLMTHREDRVKLDELLASVP